MSLHRLGLLGGMSWQSTAVYYRLLNESVGARIGGHASAPVTIHSVEFGEIEQYQRAGDWPAQGRILAEAAAAARAKRGRGDRARHEHAAPGGRADHRRHLRPVHRPDRCRRVGRAVGYRTVGLLATGYTMTSDLYPKRLAGFGTGVLVPDEADREHRARHHLPRTRARRGD